MNILVLGGTGEARALCTALLARGHDVTVSLAGRTSAPRTQAGTLRVGGFGGPEGLARYLTDHHIERLVDATHPYAARISDNAVLASAITGAPLVRLLRPGWPEPDGADWLHVPDAPAAARVLPAGARVLLTSGHGGLEAFVARPDMHFLVRLIEAPEAPLPAHMTPLLDRPPYDLEAEQTLMREKAITHLVTKNSGGDQTAAKLGAAQRLGVRVVMIDRPHYRPAPEAASVEAVLALLDA